MLEIGSEFWDATDTGRKKYLISGRAALEYIIRDIRMEYKVDSVLMPSYSCHTMIEPFVRHGIRVCFYDVFYDRDHGLCVEFLENDADTRGCGNRIFYYMTYFGFSQFSGIEAEKIREKFDLIIDDRTHSWLSSDSARTDLCADYTYTSFRKWTGVYGIAEATKKSGGFAPRVGIVGEEYTRKRKKAMGLKANYIRQLDNIESDNGVVSVQNIERVQNNKKSFLERFGDAETYLGKEYIGYTPTPECAWQFLNVDWEFLKDRRRNNSDILIDGLKDVPEVILLFDKRKKTDTPLFVPILIEKGRDELRDYLIKHQVYCPIHWPISDYHQGISERAKNLYRKELSLICDQRYTEDDMKYIVYLIRDYFGGRIKK